MAKIELVCWLIYQWIKNYFYFIFSCRRWSTWPHTDRSHEACQILTIKCSITDPLPEPEPRGVSRSHSNPGSSSNEILMDDFLDKKRPSSWALQQVVSSWCNSKFLVILLTILYTKIFTMTDAYKHSSST